MSDDDRRIDVDTIGRAIARPQNHFSGLGDDFIEWLDSHLPAGIVSLIGGTAGILMSALYIVPEVGVLVWLSSLLFAGMGIFLFILGLSQVHYEYLRD